MGLSSIFRSRRKAAVAVSSKFSNVSERHISPLPDLNPRRSLSRHLSTQGTDGSFRSLRTTSTDTLDKFCPHATDSVISSASDLSTAYSDDISNADSLATLLPRTHTIVRSRFMELPQELKDLIYEHALIADQELDIHTRDGCVPALGQVCRSIRYDTASFFIRNRFTFHILNNDIEHHFRWEWMVYDYLGPAVYLIPVRRFLWRVEPEDQHIARTNLLRWLELGFTIMPNLLEDPFMYKYEYGHELAAWNMSFVGMLSVAKSLAERSMAWEDVRSQMKCLIRMVRLCGEPW